MDLSIIVFGFMLMVVIWQIAVSAYWPECAWRNGRLVFCELAFLPFIMVSTVKEAGDNKLKIWVVISLLVWPVSIILATIGMRYPICFIFAPGVIGLIFAVWFGIIYFFVNMLILLIFWNE